MRIHHLDLDATASSDSTPTTPAISPGKSTLAEKIARFGRGTEPVQAHRDAPAGDEARAEEQLMLIAHDLPRGGGAPLPAPVQAKMSRVLGADFSGVRVHQGEHAGAIGASALASGDDLHFAPGRYDPDSRAGQELIGHELAHVVQQRAGRVGPAAQASGLVDNALEQEADTLGAQAAASGDLAPADADAAIRTATTYMMRYGHPIAKQTVPPALADAVDAIAAACAGTLPPPAERRAGFERGVAGLGGAQAIARPELADAFVAEIAVVRQHLDHEELARGETGDDPLAAMMETRAALGRAGGIAGEMAKLVTLANTKRLVAARKAVDWSALGQILAQNTQLIPSDSPEIKEAFGALEGAAFEHGFQLLDAAITVAAAGKTVGDTPALPDPAQQARFSKAVIEIAVAVLNGCMITGRLVALASAELCDGEEAVMWTTLATDLGKGIKLVGGTFSVLTAGCDIAMNAVILWNGAEGIEAADAVAGIAGSSVAILAEGSKLLLEAGIVAPAEGMFAGATAGAVVAEIAAIAAPLAVIIPLAWLGTKIVLLELGKLRIGITGALMAESFENLISDAGEVARETEALGVALNGALDPTADPQALETAIDGRIELIRARVTDLQTHAVNQRATVIRREVSALLAATGVLTEHDPLRFGAAARATVVGVMAILDRSPELVAEEAGDPSLVDRARQGAPAPTDPQQPTLPDGSQPTP